jgi:thioredoxin
VTNLSFERFLQDHSRAVVDVWAPWCVPCRSFAPVFAEAAQEWGDRVGFGKLHAGHSPTLATRLGVRSIPTLLFFRDGQVVRTHVGALSADGLRRQLRKAFRDLV